MITIDNEIIPGSDLPSKGRTPLTKSLSFLSSEYVRLPLLFKNSNTTDSSALEFMPDTILYKSLKLLIRDHYIPFTGWVEIDDTEIYLTWDNYKDGVYSPAYPVQFEIATVGISYDELYKSAQGYDPSLFHSKAPLHHNSCGKKEPPVFVKVTRLGPDSQAVVIGISISHMVADFFSLTNLLLNWSSLCCQMLENPKLQSLPEDATYEIPHPPLFGVSDFSKFRDTENMSYKEQTEDDFSNDSSFAEFLKTQSECEDYRLVIPGSKQKELREEAHSAGISFQVHLIATIVKEDIALQVRQRPKIIDDVVSFYIIADVRTRIGIPDNFCSSATFGCYIKIKVKDILEINSVEVAREIKDKMDLATTPEGICGLLDKYVSLWRDTCKKSGDAFGNFGAEVCRRMFIMPGFMINSLFHFRLGCTDFGSGRPVDIFMPKLSLNGVVLIHPKSPNASDDSIRVSISHPKGSDISDSLVLKQFIVSD